MADFEEWATTYLDIRSLSFREANVVCPFHQDHQPSLRFNLDSGLYFCHGCQKSGNASGMAIEMGVPEPGDSAHTVDDLSRMVDSIVEKEEAKTERSRLRSESWLKRFTAYGPEIYEFWHDERNISKEVIEDFMLGVDLHNEAATIPIESYENPRQFYGVVRRFTGNVTGNRYLNPTGFTKANHVLFLEKVDGTSVAVTEGPIDALRCWSAGIPAISVFGSSMSHTQAHLMKKHGINTAVSFFDNDVPGRVGTMKNDQRFKGTGIVHYSVDWSLLKNVRKADPGKLKNKQLKKLYREAVPFFRWEG